MIPTDKQIETMTLTDYLAHFPGLVDDLEHWAGYGITTATGLADYLQSCHDREMEKERRANGGYTVEELEVLAQEEADYQEARTLDDEFNMDRYFWTDADLEIYQIW